MKYYTRNGRKFVQVKSAKGMFYNNDGTFTEKRTDKSIGICVHDDFEETIIASLSVSKSPATYDVAKSACKAAFPFGEGHIPINSELIVFLNMNVIKIENYISFWTSDVYHNNFSACILYLNSSDIRTTVTDRKYSTRYVIPFLTIKK